MRIGRTLSPAAAPMSKLSFYRGLQGIVRGQSEIDGFRKDLKDYFQADYCFLLSSGKAALTLILQALKTVNPERDEVLIPAFTCYSVPSAIVRAGLKVRLADMDPHTLDYDFNALRASVEDKDRILAALSTYLFGLPASISKLRQALADSKVTVIEDAAQAMGGVAGKKYLGTLGDVGFFSLGRGKAFTTVEGGVIVTRSAELAERIHEQIKASAAIVEPGSVVKFAAYTLALSIFTHPSLFWLPKSIPALKLGETIYDPQFPVKHFSTFQAGLTRNWKKELVILQEKRVHNVQYWKRTLSRFSWMQPIPESSETLPALPLIRFPVRVQKSFLRTKLLKISEKKGLGIMPAYPGTIDAIKGLKNNGLKGEPGGFPGAKACADQLVTFPVHGFVSLRDKQKIGAALESVQAADYSSFPQTR